MMPFQLHQYRILQQHHNHHQLQPLPLKVLSVQLKTFRFEHRQFNARLLRKPKHLPLKKTTTQKEAIEKRAAEMYFIKSKFGEKASHRLTPHTEITSW